MNSQKESHSKIHNFTNQEATLAPLHAGFTACRDKIFFLKKY